MHFFIMLIKGSGILGNSVSIGRFNFISPGTGELFYIRLLLNVQRGCTSYDDIRTFNGVTYQSFREACYAMSLLIDDQEFVDAIKEAELSSDRSLHWLFVTLLLSYTISQPIFLFDNKLGICERMEFCMKKGQLCMHQVREYYLLLY